MSVKCIGSSVHRILGRFPQDQFAFCFAYGSAVKKQLGYAGPAQANAMIDTIFCIQDSNKWHQSNLQINPSHYSAIRRFGASFVSRVQTIGGAKIYFNTLIPWDDGSLLKYGVVTKNHLIEDLNDWTHLYLAGRLHKPVEVLHQPDSQTSEALQRNLVSAVRASLLMLPENFTSYELFHTVSSLSYTGDFRMIFGENKNKVHNIVASQQNEFEHLYAPVFLEPEIKSVLHLAAKKLQQSCSLDTRLQHLHQLPSALKRQILNNCWENAAKNDYTDQEQSETFEKLAASSTKTAKMVRKSIMEIVWFSSVCQSIKNIPTAGLAKSLRYSWKKALKTFAL